LKEQKKLLELNKIDKKCINQDFEDCDQIPKSWYPFHNGYISPKPEEIRNTFGEFSSSEIANMLGLSDGRVIRRWKSGESEIPYAAWRLFLIITERVVL
jgi:hypothetical protein